MAIMSGGKILDQLQKCVSYHFMSDRLKKSHMRLFDNFSSDTNVDAFARANEEATDFFIHQLAFGTLRGSKETFAMMDQAEKTTLQTFFIRLTTITDYLASHPTKELPISEDAPQFVIDCLINYWKELQNSHSPILFE